MAQAPAASDFPPPRDLRLSDTLITHTAGREDLAQASEFEFARNHVMPEIH